MGAGPAAWIAAWLAAAGASPASERPAPAPVACPGVAGRLAVAEGDACWSAGGGVVARRAPDGGAEEVRARAFLRGAREDAIAVHRGTVWLGLSTDRGDPVVPLGLVRYDWTADRAHAFRGTDSGPCGFFVRGLLVRDETLWVATELGASRLRLSPDTWDEWTHFGPEAEGEGDGETACATLLAGAADARWLAEFRPRFWKRHSRRRR